LNNSGGSRTFTYYFTIGGVAVLPGWNLDGLSFSSSSGRRIADILFRTAIISSSSFGSIAFGHFGFNPVPKNLTLTSDESGMAYNDGSDNLTGTKTVALTVQSSAAGSNQEIGPVIAVFRHIKGE
jgi:hypothetical protein